MKLIITSNEDKAVLKNITQLLAEYKNDSNMFRKCVKIEDDFLTVTDGMGIIFYALTENLAKNGFYTISESEGDIILCPVIESFKYPNAAIGKIFNKITPYNKYLVMPEIYFSKDPYIVIGSLLKRLPSNVFINFDKLRLLIPPGCCVSFYFKDNDDFIYWSAQRDGEFVSCGGLMCYSRTPWS